MGVQLIAAKGRDSALIDYATMLEGRGLIAAKGEGR